MAPAGVPESHHWPQPAHDPNRGLGVAVGPEAQAGAALVVGTTGLSKDDEAQLALAARHIPVVYAPNYSVGVTLLAALTRQVAAVLDPSWDIEIVEMHHRHKVDAPSGTALGLGKGLKPVCDVVPDILA